MQSTQTEFVETKGSSVSVLRIYLAVQSLLLLVFYFPFIAGKKQIFIPDNTNFFEPLSCFLGQAYKHGHLPLWNPYAYCGMSQVAISSPGVFYPPNLLYALFPYSVALSLIMVLSQSVCGLGAFLLVRSLGWGGAPAALCGLTMALSAYMFSLLGNHSLVEAFAPFPLLIYFLRESKQVQGVKSFIHTLGISLCAAMMILAGRPEIWLPAFVLIAALIVYLFIAERGAEVRKDWLFFSVRALLLGVLLSMPSLLPSLEWMPLSRRAGGLDPAETLMFSANWYDYLCFVVSQPLGDLTLRLSNYRSLVQTFSIGPLYGSAFISPFVFSLALMGSCPKGGLLKNLTIAMTIAFALLAYGANVPFAASLVKIIPGASLLRFPSKLLIFCVFGLALLAARGLRNYCRGTAKPVIQIALWAVPAVLALVLTTANSTVLLPFINNVTEVKTVLEAQKLVFSGLFIWSSLAVLQAVILLVLLRLKRINLAAQISCCMVAIALLYHALSICQLGAKPDYFSQPSYLVNTLKRLSGLNSNEAIRFGPYNIQNLTIPDAYQSTDPLQATISAAQYSRQILNGYTNLDFGIQSLRGYEGAMKGDYFFYCMDVYGRSSQYVSSLKGGVQDKATDLPLARLSQLAACRYAVTQSWRDLPNQGSPVNIIRTPVVQLDSVYFEKSAQDEATNLCIYKVKDPMPRAYLSFAWKTSDSHQQVLNEIGGDTSSKFDPHQFSFVEGDNLPPDSPDIQNNSVAGSSSEQKFLAVPFVEPEPEKIAISTATDKPAMLVLADQYYPGWTASVDGTPAEILRCNGFMRAVYLLPGKHQVEFSYFPSSVRNGLLLAAIAIVWQLLLLFQSLRPSRPL